MTEQEIRLKWKRLHDILSLVYWQANGKYADDPAPTADEIAEVEAVMGELIADPGNPLDLANFNRIHGALWEACQQELIDGGFVEPEQPPE